MAHILLRIGLGLAVGVRESVVVLVSEELGFRVGISTIWFVINSIVWGGRAQFCKVTFGI